MHKLHVVFLAKTSVEGEKKVMECISKVEGSISYKSSHILINLKLSLGLLDL